MSCVKTGARTYFANYGMMVVGDVFVVMDTFVFRWNIQSKDYEEPSERADYFVELVENSESWWHRDDLGVTVVPSYLVRTRVPF